MQRIPISHSKLPSIEQRVYKRHNHKPGCPSANASTIFKGRYAASIGGNSRENSLESSKSKPVSYPKHRLEQLALDHPDSGMYMTPFRQREFSVESVPSNGSNEF